MSVAAKLAEDIAPAVTANAVRELREYLDRTGLSVPEFSRRLGYGESTMRAWMAGRYQYSDALMRGATRKFIDTNPVGTAHEEAHGELYETENVRLIRSTFERLLPHPQAQMVYAPPGSQKTFALEHAVRSLNQAEISKNGHGRRAFYVYARQDIRPQDLMHRVARACGSTPVGGVDRVLNNIAFDFRNRRVLLVMDEAQHLSITCFEILRELLDRPPHFSLLFAGSHDLKNTFDTFSSRLEQWNSRIVAKVRLPGASRDEAEGIIQRELGDFLTTQKPERQRASIAKLIDASTVTDHYAEKGAKYINIRTLTNALNQIKQARGEASA